MNAFSDCSSTQEKTSRYSNMCSEFSNMSGAHMCMFDDGDGGDDDDADCLWNDVSCTLDDDGAQNQTHVQETNSAADSIVQDMNPIASSSASVQKPFKCTLTDEQKARAIC